MSDGVLEAFEQAEGVQVEVLQQGDAGAVVRRIGAVVSRLSLNALKSFRSAFECQAQMIRFTTSGDSDSVPGRQFHNFFFLEWQKNEMS